MVDFAGWSMPLHYRGGINQEHIAVRTGVGLFDVSHMGEVRVLGDGAGDFLSFATLNDPSRLRTGRAQYNMIPNASGGLIDDVYLYRDGDNEFLLVANAANTTAVVAHLKELAKPFRCHVLDESDTWSLLALQGPGGALLLGRLVDVDLTSLRKNRSTDAEISGCPVRLTRTGYTGEDGFEIFCHPTDGEIVWEILTAAGAQPCGLGARDSLRLEAGFPLYGYELTATTNPLCTPYKWVVKDKPFFGREALWDSPCEQLLVGLRLLERGIARAGYRLLSGEAEVGTITSGTISSLTRDSIAFAWLRSELATDGQPIDVEIRGQRASALVVSPPFFKQSSG